jgi:hypothetical protein
MNELEQLKHRLAMIKDDLDVIRSFIYSEQLDKTFFDQAKHQMNDKPKQH